MKNSNVLYIGVRGQVTGKIPEEICLKLLTKYTEEQNVLKSEIDELGKQSFPLVCK